MRAWLPALFLVALAAGLAVFAPLTVDLQRRPELSLPWIAASAFLLAAGSRFHRLSVQALGSLLLWCEIAVSLSTQVVPFGTPFGSTWAPRVLLLTLVLVAWALLMRPAAWLRRGLVAGALATALAAFVFWLAVPRVGLTASLTWLAVDSHGSLYATENDNGAIWRFARDGSRSLLYPARAIVGQPGLGWQPAGLGVELPPLTNTQIVNASAFRQPLLFCGLSVDSDDQLYIVDPNRHEVRQFAQDGQLNGVWPLPPNYSLTQGCIAATRERVYVGDANGYIHVLDHAGLRLSQWQATPAVRGLAPSTQDQLFVLRERSITLLRDDGTVAREWPLPAPVAGLSAPYQSLLVRRNGEFLVTDVNRRQVRRFDSDGRELPVLGKAATWPGLFAGPGGLPGEIVEPLGLAEDDEGNLYVSDTAFRVIQRLTREGAVNAVITALEDESNERFSEPCANAAC